MKRYAISIFFISSLILASEQDKHSDHDHAKHKHEVFVDGKNFKLDEERFKKFQKGLQNVQVAIVNVQGMVCDFCARGIEKTFKKDFFVKKIDVDLENGKVVIAYSLDKKVKFEEIKEKILNNGQNATDFKLLKI